MEYVELAANFPVIKDAQEAVYTVIAMRNLAGIPNVTIATSGINREVLGDLVRAAERAIRAAIATTGARCRTTDRALAVANDHARRCDIEVVAVALMIAVMAAAKACGVASTTR